VGTEVTETFGDTTGLAENDLRFAAALTVRLVQGRQRNEPVYDRFVDQWWNEPDDTIETALRERNETFATRRRLAFLFAERCAYTASEQHDTDQLRRMGAALIDGLYLVSQSNDEPADVRSACLAAAHVLLDVSGHPLRRPIVASIQVQSDTGDHTGDHNTGLYEAVGISWDELLDLRTSLSRALTAMLPLPETAVPLMPGAADTLLALAARRDHSHVPPAYDAQDAHRRVTRIELSSFRGAPLELSMDFLIADKAVSAIVFGDNGVGKSTLVDSIEFALQGRIGRSINFDGPLSPSAASFAVDTAPTTCVTLDDGTTVARSLELHGNGKLRAVGQPARPGFRLAPIALKRQDILRFLDTDALARGHVFFDYFPTKAEEMAVRPEELLQLLDDEAYELRIVRRALLSDLSATFAVEEEDIDTKDKLVRVVSTRLLDGESFNAAQQSGVWETIPEVTRVKIAQLLHALSRLSWIKKQQRQGVQTLNPVAYREQASAIANVLDGVGEHLTAAFKQITGASHIDSIEVVFGGSGPVSLDIVLVLDSGRRCFPQQVFSEGYRDLLAILFFAVMARRAAEQGQAKLLILDDVFQSVDATVRNATVEYLLNEFSGWQLIFTVHDRLWFEQLRNAFQRHQHRFVERELRRWSFAGGPVATTPSELTTALERELLEGDPGGICAIAGRTLEQISDQLSARLGTSVKRRRDDKYTLNDLWPGVRKTLKRTQVDGVAGRIDELYALRNLAGAHYNQFAETLSRSESERFGEAVLELAQHVWCRDCHDWVNFTNGTIACVGGHLTLTAPGPVTAV
jgi:energy-coupling factor transporter ATP-binding protein EcfA2